MDVGMLSLPLQHVFGAKDAQYHSMFLSPMETTSAQTMRSDRQGRAAGERGSSALTLDLQMERELC